VGSEGQKQIKQPHCMKGSFSWVMKVGRRKRRFQTA